MEHCGLWITSEMQGRDLPSLGREVARAMDAVLSEG